MILVQSVFNEDRYTVSFPGTNFRPSRWLAFSIQALQEKFPGDTLEQSTSILPIGRSFSRLHYRSS